jgi:hypothetical protein
MYYNRKKKAVLSAIVLNTRDSAVFVRLNPSRKIAPQMPLLEIFAPDLPLEAEFDKTHEGTPRLQAM